MALRFRNTIPYAVPGVLALLGCWWMYSHRKKHAGPRRRPAGAAATAGGAAAPQDSPSPATGARAPRGARLSSEEECPENEASTFPLSAGPMTPSLLCQSHERLDLSQDLSDLSLTTVQPSTPEDDGGELEGISSPDESSPSACAPSPPVSSSAPCPSAAVSLVRGPSPGASRQLAVAPARGSPGSAERAEELPWKPPEEAQVPASAPSNAGSAPEKEAGTPQASPSTQVEVSSSHRSSAASGLAAGSEPAGVEPSREQEAPGPTAGAAPACRDEDAQPTGDESEREEAGGVSFDEEEVEKIEQVAIQIISKVILAATEQVLSGSPSDVSTRVCRAAAGRAERPLEMPCGESSDQTLEEEEAGANSLAVKSDAGGLTSPQPEGRDRGVTDHSCSASCAQADGTDCRGKNRLCEEPADADRTPLESHGGVLAQLPLVAEDCGCGTSASGGGAGVEDPLQDTVLCVASGRRLDSPGLSVTPGASAEQSSGPSEQPPTPRLPEDSQVPYSNGLVEEDGPDSPHECSRAEGMEGDRSGGSDVDGMDFVDSGCAMRKTVTRQNAKLGGESSKSDFVIWEIEVPKELVGRLIGKQGRFMSFLRQASGAKIYVSTLPYFHDSQVCHIEGSAHQVEKVLSLIGKKFKELCLTNIYALPPPTPLTLHSLLMTAWLFLPDGVTVEVVVANQVDAGHMFLQQHTHPTFHVLRSLDQQMYACYSQPEIPTLPTPVEVGIICAAPGQDGAWLRAQVISYFEETNEVELRYVDYGGYNKVKVDTLRQIRSDFLSLPFQGAEVLLDNVVPLPDEDRFSPEADAAVSEMTRGAVLVAQVTNYDSATGLPLIQLWNLMGDEVVSINRTLVERGFAQWLDY